MNQNLKNLKNPFFGHFLREKIFEFEYKLSPSNCFWSLEKYNFF